MKVKLNEDLFDDVEVPAVELDSVIETADEALPGPEPGEDNGLANLIIDTINDEWEAIQGYNILKANIGSHSDFISIIDDIAAEENNHVGMLQQMLQQISPNTEVIQQGEEEARLELNEDFNYDTLREAISGIFDAVDSRIIAEDLLEMVPEDMLSQVVKKLCQKYGVDCNF